MADRNSQTIAKEFIEENNYGSIITVIMVIGIMIQVMKILQSCNTENSENLYGVMKKNTASPSWFTKLRLKKILKRNLPKEVYKQYNNKLISDLLLYSQNMTEADFSRLETEAFK